MLLWNDFFLGLSLGLLLKSDCPISIFSGLGGHGLSFFHFRAVIEHIVLTYVIFIRFSPIITPPLPSPCWPTFFTILDNDRVQFLAPSSNHGSLESLLVIIFSEGASELANGKIPPLFPNQWTRSCMAINTTSGLIHWVVEGNLVMSTTSQEVKNSKN